MNRSVHILAIIIYLTFIVTPKYTMMGNMPSSRSSTTGSQNKSLSVGHEMLYITEYPKNDHRLPAPWDDRYSAHAIQANLRITTEQILEYVASNVHYIAECFITLKTVIKVYEIPLTGGSMSIYDYLKQNVAVAKVPTIAKYELQLLGTVPFQPPKHGDSFETLEQLAKKSSAQSLNQYNELIQLLNTEVPSKKYFVESLFIMYLVIRHLHFRFGDYLRAIKLHTVIEYIEKYGRFSAIFKTFFNRRGLQTLKEYITCSSIDSSYYHRGIEVLIHCLKPVILILNGREKEVLYLAFIMYLNLLRNYHSILINKENRNFIRNSVLDRTIMILEDYYDLKPRFFVWDTETQTPLREAQYIEIHRQHTCDTTECSSKYQFIQPQNDGYDIAKMYQKLVELSESKREVRMILDLTFAAIKERSKFGPKWIKIMTSKIPKAGVADVELFPDQESICQPHQFAEALKLDEMPCEIYIDVRTFFDPK